MRLKCASNTCSHVETYFFLCMTICKHACILKLVASIFWWNSCIVLLVSSTRKHATQCFSIQLMNVYVRMRLCVIIFHTYQCINACVYACTWMCMHLNYLLEGMRIFNHVNWVAVVVMVVYYSAVFCMILLMYWCQVRKLLMCWWYQMRNFMLLFDVRGEKRNVFLRFYPSRPFNVIRERIFFLPLTQHFKAVEMQRIQPIGLRCSPSHQNW
jgi:hypothetical protein